MRRILRWLLGVIYLGVGVVHLRSPEAFLPIMPDWVPFPELVVLGTGVWEILGAAALLWPGAKANFWGGAAMAAYAVAVYPANIQHAMLDLAQSGQELAGQELAGQGLGWSYHAPRLAFQPVFVWWALWCGGVIDWPFRKK